MNGFTNHYISAMQDFIANPCVKRWRGVERLSDLNCKCLLLGVSQIGSCVGCPFYSFHPNGSACPRLNTASRKKLNLFIPRLVLACLEAIAYLQAKE